MARSLWNWVTLAGYNLLGIGTNLKFYIENGGAYHDITPLRATVTLGANPFALTASTTVTVTAASHGCLTGDFVTFTGAANIGAVGTNVTSAILNQEFQVTVTSPNTYTITISVTPNATAIAGSPGGGSAVVAAYQLNTGSDVQLPTIGWGGGTWGNGLETSTSLQLWSQANFGEDLVYGPRGQGIYYWNVNVGYSPIQITISIASPGVITLPAGFSFPDGTAITFTSTGALPTGLSVGQVYFVVSSTGGTFSVATSIGGSPITTTGTQSGLQYISQRGVDLADAGDADAPLFQNVIQVSDIYRFVLVFGTNDYGQTYLDPMLIRWSDQEDPYTWTPAATNQAGSLRLSHGSAIQTVVQTRQEMVVFTD